MIESPASDPNPGFTTYPGLEITIFSGLPGFFLGSPGNFQGALSAPWIFSREPWEFSGSPFGSLDFFEGAQMNFREPILTRPK